MNDTLLKRLSFLVALCLILCMAVCPDFCRAEPFPDKQSTPLNVSNLLDCAELEPYVTFSFPDYLRMRSDVMVVEHQFLGRMVTLEPGENITGMPFFQAVIILLKSYDDHETVMKQYLDDLHGYVLEQDFEHHSISSLVMADGFDRIFALPGRGYVVSGIISRDNPLQGVPFSEEFRNFILPGNANLRIIFKYPTAAQNNELMRRCLENILTMTLVHGDYFNLSGDTSLHALKRR